MEGYAIYTHGCSHAAISGRRLFTGCLRGSPPLLGDPQRKCMYCDRWRYFAGWAVEQGIDPLCTAAAQILAL